MKKADVTNKLKQICGMGYLPTQRKSDTGVGHTFEHVFGVSENNIPIPDIGGKVEIKTCRSTSSSLISLFTFNRAVWKMSQIDAIRKYGITENNRQNLYTTILYKRPTLNGLYLDINEEKHVLWLKDRENQIVAEWDIYVVVGKFNTKLSRVLLVIADSKEINGVEHFHYNNAYLLIECDVRKFIQALKSSLIAIDIRMHINTHGSVRNHGTAIRCSLVTLKDLYQTVEHIVL